MRTKYGWMMVGAIALMSATSAVAQDLPPIPNVMIEQVECPFTPPLGEMPVCLMAELPMDHEQVRANGSLPADAARIGVHITLLPNHTSSDDPNPLLVLSGGPGQAGSDFIGVFGGAVELRRNRAVMLVDQRGTGLSDPALYCPEVAASELDQNPFNDPSTPAPVDPDQALVDGLTECHDHWIAAGVDLSKFDTRAASLDMRAIREALNLRHWNLHGTSYGARLAMDVLRVDPTGVRSVILNSPIGMQTQATAEAVALRPQLFEQLFADCAADAYCSERYGDLQAKFLSVAQHFQESPMLLRFQHPGTGEMVEESVGWPDLIEVLSGHLAFSETAMYMPLYIAQLYEVSQGQSSLDDQQKAAIFSPALDEVIDALALGQHLSVKCREDFPIEDEAALELVAQSHPLYYPQDHGFGNYRLACPIWHVGRVSASFSAPLESNHPILIMSGDADGLVPHALAQRLSESLPNSQFVAFRGMGHDVYSQLLCGRSIVANFLDAPNQALDRSCVADVGPRFE